MQAVAGTGSIRLSSSNHHNFIASLLLAELFNDPGVTCLTIRRMVRAMIMAILCLPRAPVVSSMGGVLPMCKIYASVIKRPINKVRSYIASIPLSRKKLTTLNTVHLELLYEKLKPDVQLFHNSKQYDGRQNPQCSSGGDDERHLTKLLKAGCRDSPLVRRNFNHPIQRLSQGVALQAARRLSAEKRLLASIIVPLTHNIRPYDPYRIISTLAYQISRNIPSSTIYILRALQENPCILELDCNAQINELIVTPLILAATHSTIEEKMRWPNIIVVDSFAHQLMGNSVLDQITTSLLSLSLHESIHDIRLSILVTSSTTMLDRAAEGITIVQCYATGRRGGIVLACCYFSGRVTYALTPFGPVWPKRLWRQYLNLSSRALPAHKRVSHFTFRSS